MTDLRTAALRALERLIVHHRTWDARDDLNVITALRAALSQPEDKSQAAFEHWVETVEATQGCAISRNAVADAAPIIQPEIKADNETRWLPMPWKGLTEEEHNYYKALGFVGVKAVEEKLRAKNSTLACIPAVPPG
jgi:hypothetical protein